MEKFTAHNILLDNGEQTLPEAPLLKKTNIFKAVNRTINCYFQNSDKSKIKIVDLGCLEGGYSVELARSGYEVLGIEARASNLRKCRYVAQHLKLPNLHFVKDDVRNLEKYGQFNIIFCSGLLYHLDQPCSFLKLLGKLAINMLILQTHYSPNDQTNDIKEKYHLSDLTSNEGKSGRWFVEYDLNETKKYIEELHTWCAYGNHKSFWLNKKDLLQSIIESGFDIVYEQYDYLDSIIKNSYIENYSRSLFIGLKLPAQ